MGRLHCRLCQGYLLGHLLSHHLKLLNGLLKGCVLGLGGFLGLIESGLCHSEPCPVVSVVNNEEKIPFLHLVRLIHKHLCNVPRYKGRYLNQIGLYKGIIGGGVGEAVVKPESPFHENQQEHHSCGVENDSLPLVVILFGHLLCHLFPVWCRVGCHPFTHPFNLFRNMESSYDEEEAGST